MSIRALGQQFIEQVKHVKRVLDEDHQRKMKDAPIDNEDRDLMEFK